MQFWGDTPSCNATAPECFNPYTGNAECCTSNCEVLGVGIPLWTVNDPYNPDTGGLNLTYTGVPPEPNDPAQCLVSSRSRRCARQAVTQPCFSAGFIHNILFLLVFPPSFRRSRSLRWFSSQYNPKTGAMDEREITFTLNCDAGVTDGIAIDSVTEPSECSYLIVARTAAACGCSPDCSGKFCGDDGCGGYCSGDAMFGQCPYPQTCNNGLCLRSDW